MKPGTTGFAAVNGARLHFGVVGEGHPLVLIHAGIADSRMWDDQIVLFAERYTVVRSDMRGFGRSDLPAGAFAHGDDLAGLLRFLEIGRAHLVGASFGGTVALDFALAHPDRVARLVLVASSPSGHQAPEEVQRYWEAEEAALDRGDLAAATELTLRTWVDGPNRTPDRVAPAVRERVREMQLCAYTLLTPAAVERPPQSNAEGRLAEVQAPTLIVVGDQDIPDKLAVADRLAAGIPGARKVMVPGAAHMVNVEQPAVFNRIVLEFLGAA